MRLMLPASLHFLLFFLSVMLVTSPLLSIALLLASALTAPFVFEYSYSLRRRIMYLLAPPVLAVILVFLLSIPPRGFSEVLAKDTVEFSVLIMCSVWFNVSLFFGIGLYYKYGASRCVRRWY